MLVEKGRVGFLRHRSAASWSGFAPHPEVFRLWCHADALGAGVLVEAPWLTSERLCLCSRIQLAEKFVKAVSKPSRPDMNPIR